MQYKVVKNFRGSPDGCRVVNFSVGDVLTENTDFPMSLIEVAMKESWVKPVRARKKTVKAK